MSENDLLMLDIFVKLYGLPEVLRGLSKICEDQSNAIAGFDAHQAKELTAYSVHLVNFAAELEYA
jgi:hypothetical protein